MDSPKADLLICYTYDPSRGIYTNTHANSRTAEETRLLSREEGVVARGTLRAYIFEIIMTHGHEHRAVYIVVGNGVPRPVSAQTVQDVLSQKLTPNDLTI